MSPDRSKMVKTPKTLRPPLRTGEFRRVYDPSPSPDEPWYLNDHCIVRGRDGLWHVFGITHPEPLHPTDERLLAHATAQSLTQSPWERQPFALKADYDNAREFHLWAPCVVSHDNLYYMYVCVGDRDNSRYRTHLFTSTDLWSWTRHPENPVLQDGYDARDPFVLRVGEQWVLYYTATDNPCGGYHIVAARTSTDLVHWSERSIVFVDSEMGTSGGSTESPFVVKRGDAFYLFICSNDRRGGYDCTEIYQSADPFLWTQDDLVGTLNAHAAEIIRDGDGQWYASHCGWGRGGLHLAPLYWEDGLKDDPA
jgi:beta-fructofuranosidase